MGSQAKTTHGSGHVNHQKQFILCLQRIIVSEVSKPWFHGFVMNRPV